MARGKRTILIVHYSETGHTEAVATALDKALDATVERLTAPRLAGRRGFWAFMWRAVTALAGRAATIAPPRHDPAGFDLVILAAPVWGGRLATPMRAYLERFRGRFGNVAFVATLSSGNASRIFDDFAALTGQAGDARLTLSNADRQQHRDSKKIADFAAALSADEAAA